MYYAAESNIKSNFYNKGRKLKRTDGVFPTATMRLHQRVVGWHRKRRIPVRDGDKPSTLNAYLIDPKYLEKGEVVPPTVLPTVQQPTAALPIYQYSKITRSAEDTPALSSPFTQSAIGVLTFMKAGALALGTEIAARTRGMLSPKPVTRYAVNNGVLPSWKHRFKVFSAALLSGTLLVAAATLNSPATNVPKPVSAHSDASSTERLASTNEPIHTSSITTPGNSNSSNSTARTAANPTPINTPSTAAMAYQPTATSLASQVTAPVAQPAPTTSTPTTNTGPVSVPTTPVSAPLAPVVDPVVNTVNSVLSTQVTVPVPLADPTSKPLVGISL